MAATAGALLPWPTAADLRANAWVALVLVVLAVAVVAVVVHQMIDQREPIKIVNNTAIAGLLARLQERSVRRILRERFGLTVFIAASGASVGIAFAVLWRIDPVLSPTASRCSMRTAQAG